MRLVLALAAIGLAGGSPRDDGPLERFEFRQPHMGTEFKVVVYAKDEATARRASRAAFDRVEELNSRLSDYDPDSELMRLCDRAGGDPVAVSEDLYRVLDRALQVARATEGAFDPTVNPVVRLWRRARRTGELPDPELLARARDLVDYRKVRLDPGHRTVQLLEKGMKLDLGGIAKGFAADEAFRVLEAQGLRRALVAAAGDIRVGDPPPGKVGWIVAVAALRAEDGAAGDSPALLLANRAVSTSGDAEQFVEIGGVRYSHIVDPRTGVGVVGRSSATVVATDATTTDSLATALSVLGPEAGLKLIAASPGAECYVVEATDEGFRVTTSPGWGALAKGADPDEGKD
jgi:thiamine biosynthesis lipoprotein